ncbi:hypothetical protein ES703_76218 [subsurface metagenome]
MWVIAALASLAVLTVFVLCVPLDIVFRLDADGRPRFRMRLVWLFGLVSKEITKAKKKPEEERRVAEGKRKPRKRKIKARTILKILRTRGLLRQLKRLLKDVLRRLKIRDLTADITVGLGDPADTGLLFAVIGPATFFLGSSQVHEIRVRPSFKDEAIFEGYLSGAVRLLPIQLVIPSLRFVFSLATIRVVKTLVVSKWRRKK